MKNKIYGVFVTVLLFILILAVFVGCGTADLRGTWYDSIYSASKLTITDDNHFSFGAASGGELTLNDDDTITMISDFGGITKAYYEEKDGDECITTTDSNDRLNKRFYRTQEIADNHRESDRKDKKSEQGIKDE